MLDHSDNKNSDFQEILHPAWQWMDKISGFWLVLPAILLAIIMKGLLIVSNSLPFNADEAIVALMARHILNGHRPVFFYGQAYMGSLDAWLVSLGFAVLGEQVWVIRAVQVVLYGSLMITTYCIGKQVSNNNRVGILAVWLMVVPTINVTLYTTASLGGYGEALLIGNLIIITTISFLSDYMQYQRRAIWKGAVLGLLVGSGVWVFGLTLVYSLPAVIYIVWWMINHRNLPSQSQPTRDRLTCKSIISFIIGLVIGLTPWWVYVLRSGSTVALRELSGSAIAGVEGLTWLGQAGQHIINLLLLGSTVIFGIRPPWSVEWLVLPLLPFIIILWGFVFMHILRLSKRALSHDNHYLLLVGIIAITVIGYIFSPFGADPSGRYFLPLIVPMTIMAADWILQVKRRFGLSAYLLAGFVILYNLIATQQVIQKNPAGITTQFDAVTQIDHDHLTKLIDFLEKKGETRGYTNYWVSYPMAFLSQEKLIFIPSLPYHTDFRYTERDNRYPPYQAAVDKAQRIAYITTKHPALNEYLRQQFSKLGVHWEEEEIGDYRVFYSFSERVMIDQIGLGQTMP